MSVYGCKKPQEDIRDYKIVCGAAQLPKSYKCSTSLPRIKNQESVSSCVAHATSSILENYTSNKIKLSTNFIYGMDGILTGKNDYGMYLVTACKIAKKYGDMTEEDCSGNSEVPTVTKIAKQVLKDYQKTQYALNFKIDSYYRCSTYNDVKYGIYNYGPVLGCIYWHGEYSFDKDVIKFNTKKDGGYHAIMIYGWNDIGWLVQNSWGTSFGNGGRCIIPYEYPLVEVRVLVDNTPHNDKHLKKTNIKKKRVIHKPINSILRKLKKNTIIKK